MSSPRPANSAYPLHGVHPHTPSAPRALDTPRIRMLRARGRWHAAGHALRRGARCGAACRDGHACRTPAMANGRCRMHGGASTGPRTPHGLARSRAARLVHGRCSTPALTARRRRGALVRRSLTLAKWLRAGAPLDRRPDFIWLGAPPRSNRPRSEGALYQNWDYSCFLNARMV